MNLGEQGGAWGRGAPGGTRGAAGTQGSLSRCSAPAPGRCTCPKHALAPKVPEKERHS